MRAYLKKPNDGCSAQKLEFTERNRRIPRKFPNSGTDSEVGFTTTESRLTCKILERINLLARTIFDDPKSYFRNGFASAQSFAILHFRAANACLWAKKNYEYIVFPCQYRRKNDNRITGRVRAPSRRFIKKIQRRKHKIPVNTLQKRRFDAHNAKIPWKSHVLARKRVILTPKFAIFETSESIHNPATHHDHSLTSMPTLKLFGVGLEPRGKQRNQAGKQRRTRREKPGSPTLAQTAKPNHKTQCRKGKVGKLTGAEKLLFLHPVRPWSVSVFLVG